jgi:hypothetical protein
MKYNPDEYETVKSRKAKFYQVYPDGRIIVELISPEKIEGEALFRASVYMTAQDQEKGLARGVGYAYEIRDRQMSISNTGKEYESVNYSSWTENAEESAVGRALDNAGFSGNKKPSLDEMQKAERMSNNFSKQKTVESMSKDELTAVLTDEPMTDGLTSICPLHNEPMVQGFAKSTGDPYWYHKVQPYNKMCFGKGVK